MRKWVFCLLLAMSMLISCQQRKNTPVTDTQTNTPSQTATEQTLSTETPTPSETTPLETPKAEPVKAAPTTAAATSSKKETTNTVANKKTTVQTAAVAPNPLPAEGKPIIAAPDRPVFEGEELIDTTERLLSPYAALVPDPTAKQTVPWAYEQLKYGIYYGFIKAGTSYIRNRGLVSINGRWAYLLQTSAFSATVIDAVFKVRDINYSWLDAKEFYSHGYGQSVREGNYRRDEWLRFDYSAQKYVGQVQKKEAPKSISGPLTMHVLDILGALYYVRAQKLEIGQDIILDVVNREKQYPLLVKVLKKETVKTAAGKFNCVVVEPQIRGEGIFVAKGKSLKVWLTDDQYKMPVKMSVEVFIGSVSAELLAYQRQAPANIL